MARFARYSLRIAGSSEDPFWAIVVRAMRESDTFLAILDEGREIQARRLIRRLARRTLAESDEPTVRRLEGITDIERLERIIQRAGEAPTWQDLLDTPLRMAVSAEGRWTICSTIHPLS
jgi:hypothetical protein